MHEDGLILRLAWAGTSQAIMISNLTISIDISYSSYCVSTAPQSLVVSAIVCSFPWKNSLNTSRFRRLRVELSFHLQQLELAWPSTKRSNVVNLGPHLKLLSTHLFRQKYV